MSALGTDPGNELLVVTGAASGIGRAVVSAAAAAGATVLALDVQDADARLQQDNKLSLIPI